MFDCTIYLCAFVYSNPLSGYPSVVSLNKNYYEPLYIKVEKSDNSIKDYLYTIIDEYTNAKPDRVKPLLLDISKRDNQISIYYTCTLPIDTKIVNAYNIALSLASNNLLVRKSLMYV